MQSVCEPKASLRRTVLARRDALPESDRIEMSLRAGEIGLSSPLFDTDFLATGPVVSGFFPIRSEIDIRPLLFQLQNAFHGVLDISCKSAGCIMGCMISLLFGYCHPIRVSCTNVDRNDQGFWIAQGR